MSLIDNLNKLVGRKPTLSGNTVLVLTPLGVNKQDKFDMPANKSNLMTKLKEDGPSTITEISNDLGMDEGVVKDISRDLLGKHYIRIGEAS